MKKREEKKPGNEKEEKKTGKNERHVNEVEAF